MKCVGSKFFVAAVALIGASLAIAWETSQDPSSQAQKSASVASGLVSVTAKIFRNQELIATSEVVFPYRQPAYVLVNELFWMGMAITYVDDQYADLRLQADPVSAG